MTINCEQEHCPSTNEFEQFYCVKCDMELCPICIYEHRTNYSKSGKTCDDEICFGTREENNPEMDIDHEMDIDQMRELQREQNFERMQRSIETGGDY